MAENRSPLSTDPYKGVRDFYPEDMFIQNYIFEVMRNTAESFGYLEYNASILEPAELYEAKTGEEIVTEQTYAFTDRGNRRVTLRPEMTPSVARMVAAKRRELPLPLRLYSIPNLFRYERPQRGRLREHWQLNCDLFGASGIEADVEIISLAARIMKAYGAKERDFEIRINNRKALNRKFEAAGLSDEQTHKVYKLLDKKAKIDDFKEQLRAITDVPLDLGAPDPETALVIRELKAQGITNAVYAEDVVRGFDYYTGIVFEVFDTSPENNRSLFGGGRYDNLLDIFGRESLPTIGFGMGDVTIRDFLATHNLLPEYASSTTLFIATTSPEYIPEAMRLANVLRAEDIPVAVNLLDRKVGDQIKAANKMKIPYLICLGENEKKTKRYSVKTLATGDEKEVSESDLSTVLWSEDVA